MAILPVMLELYDRLFPEMREGLQNFIHHVAGELSNSTLTVKAGPLLVTAEHIKEAAQAYRQMNVDLIVITHVAYAPSAEILPAIQDSPYPCLLWPIQPRDGLIPEAFQAVDLRFNHGMHGSFDLSNMLKRRSVPHGVLYGHWQAESVRSELWGWLHAGRIYRAMSQSNPIVIGGRFDGMLDLQVDHETFLHDFNLEYRDLPMSKLVEMESKLDVDQVKDRKHMCEEQFCVSDDLTDALLTKSVRHALALERLLGEYGSTAFSVNFISTCNNPEIADGLHLAASGLMADGVGYAGEGDWLTAALLRGCLSDGLPASFTELFSVGYADNRFVLRHWGEGNYQLARGRPRIAYSCCKDKHHAEFVITDFEFQPGEVLLLNLHTTASAGGQLIVIRGRIEPDHLPYITGPRAVFRPSHLNARDCLTAYAAAGGSHHQVLIKDGAPSILKKLSQLTGLTFVEL